MKTGKLKKMSLRSSIRLTTSRFIEFYDYKAENSQNCILYVPGFQGSGHGLKSQALKEHCQKQNLRYVCYDPEGLGESKLQDFSKLQFKHWFENAEAAIQKCQAKKLILVGSSMGGWISLKMAQDHPDLVQGLLLLAPAVNFLKPAYQNWYENSSQEVKNDQDAGKLTLMDPTYGSVPVSQSFVEKSTEMELSDKIQVNCPVKIIHGVQDETIPYQNSLKVLNMIQNDNVELLFVKSGDHRMQSESHLEIIKSNLDHLISKIF